MFQRKGSRRGIEKVHTSFSKGIVVGFLLLVLFTSAVSQPAQAADKSRVFIWLLFLSGLGSSTAGAIMQGQANETYDKYMHTAFQAEMEELIEDYDQKHKQSVIASRAGMGLVVSAILLSLVDVAHTPPPESQETPSLFGYESKSISEHTVSTHAHNGDILLAIGSRF
jgi:hypothetical protein